MGDNEALIEVVTRAREEMRQAQDNARATPKPANACTSHDAVFALAKSQTNALDVLLMLKEQDMKDKRERVGEGERRAEDGGRKTLWDLVCANFKTCVWALAAVMCFAVVFGELEKLGGFVKAIRGQAAATAWEAREGEG